MDKLPTSISYQTTPVKQKQELVNALEDMNLGDKTPSPQPPPTPSRKRGVERLQEVVDDGDDAELDVGRKFGRRDSQLSRHGCHEMG
mmetsp:Transcript_21505/g.38900  ORF Transcript_21505/g.38900 Transcript_21505/m.38900 type:complete len:87 (+) Transcript_21505:1024-1284(+)